MTAIATLLGDRRVPVGTAARSPRADRTDAHDPGGDRPTSVAGLRRGARAVVDGLGEGLPAASARRLLDLGFVPGAVVEFVRRAPMADPVIVRVADYDIALRREQAAHIRVTPLS